MKKPIKLTKKEITAVKRSIAHWKKDIQRPLLKGGMMLGLPFPNWADGTPVKCFMDDCPLCKLAGYTETTPPDCGVCPLTRFYGCACATLKPRDYWGKFFIFPTIKTCNLMIRALERILENSKEGNNV